MIRKKTALNIIAISALTLVVGYAAFSKFVPKTADLASSQAKTKVSLQASWARSYDSVQELTDDSDFIGLVEITGISGVESRPSGSDNGDRPMLYFTTYSAKVIHGIKSDKSTIEIIMTGKKDNQETMEIKDDPLMTAGEQWLIFARLNGSGKYTILSGPDGRFYYNPKDKTVTSLNNVNSAVAQMHQNMKINFKNEKLDVIEEQIKKHLEKK